MTLRTHGGRIWTPTPRKPPGVSIVDDPNEAAKEAEEIRAASGDQRMTDGQGEVAENGVDEGHDGQSPPADVPPPQPRTAVPEQRRRANGTNGARGAVAPPQPAPGFAALPVKDLTPKPNAYSPQADHMWGEMCGEEHPRCLAKLGLSPYDVYIDICVLEGKIPTKVESTPGQAVMDTADQPAAQRIYDFILSNVHMVTATKPMQYQVEVRRRQGAEYVGRGIIGYQSPEQIHAMRLARERNKMAQPGMGLPPYMQMPQQSYQAPAPPPQQQPQYQPAQAQQEDPSMNHGGGYGGSGGGRAPQQPGFAGDQQPRHLESEVSNLRAEFGELRGMLREVVDNQRRTTSGLGANPPAAFDARDEELASLRAEIGEMRSALYTRPAPSAPSAPAYAPQPPQPASSSRAPRGPNGEIYVEGVGWCVPRADQAQPLPAAPAAAGVGAAPPVAQQAAAPAVASSMQMEAAFARMQNVMIDAQANMMTQVANSVVKEMTKTMRGLGAAPAQQPEPQQEEEEQEEEEKQQLPFDVIDMPDGTKLFGQPVKYAADRKTGNISVKGLVAANPVLVEKAMEAAGQLVGPVTDLIKRAAMNSGSGSAAGVGATPQLPDTKKSDGSGGAPAAAAPPGGWPEV